MSTPERFVNFHDGRGVMDTQMDPRVLAAQEEAAARKQGRKSAPVTSGFSEPSEDEMRRKREES